MATNVPRAQWTGDPAVTGAVVSHAVASDITASGPVRLEYEGKALHADVLEARPVEPVRLWGSGGGGRLYAGDNLPVLAHLATDPLVRGQVRMAYLDPPFATNGVFQSRTQRDAYSDLLTGAASIEALRQRLIFIHDLLSEDGSVYVHLDQNLAFHAKMIMDEIFEPKNFRAWITRRKCNPKNYTKKHTVMYQIT